MRFTHIDVNFYVRYEGHQNCPKILSLNILRVFSDHHLWRQNWCQYVWTSLCQFNFLVNLLHSLGVWFFDIWHLFDNLTSFWQLDIFLTVWVQITHGPHCPCAQLPIPLYPIVHVHYCPMCPIAHHRCPHWVMGHMGNGGNRVQGVWATWAMGPMGNVETGGNGVQGIWGTWAMRPTGGMGYRVWATWAIAAQGV